MKKATLLLLGIATVIAASACKKAGDSASSTEIPVGEFASLTGGTASFGQSSHKGTMMAIDEASSSHSGHLGSDFVENGKG